jgi:hypothetical protein
MNVVRAVAIAAALVVAAPVAEARNRRKERGGLVVGQHYGYSTLATGAYEDALVHGDYLMLGVYASWEDEDDAWRMELDYGYEATERDLQRDHDASHRTTETRLSHGWGLDLCGLFRKGGTCGTFDMRTELFLGAVRAEHRFEASDRYPGPDGEIARIKERSWNPGAFAGLSLTPRIGHPERLRGLAGLSRFLFEIPIRQTWTRMRVRADRLGLDAWVLQSQTTVGFGVAF